MWADRGSCGRASNQRFRRIFSIESKEIGPKLNWRVCVDHQASIESNA